MYIYIYKTVSSPIWGFSIWELGPGLMSGNTCCASTRSLSFFAATSPLRSHKESTHSHKIRMHRWHHGLISKSHRLAKAIMDPKHVGDL